MSSENAPATTERLQPNSRRNATTRAQARLNSGMTRSANSRRLRIAFSWP
jgi:hypothetical protein